MTPQFTEQEPLLRFCPVAGVQLESVGNVHAHVWLAHSGQLWDRIKVVCVLIENQIFERGRSVPDLWRTEGHLWPSNQRTHGDIDRVGGNLSDFERDCFIA